MGSSGNWVRWNSKKITENSRRIDIHWMYKKGLLRNGSIGSISWKSRGEQTGSIGYIMSSDKMLLNYRCRPVGEDWESIEQEIKLTFTPCNYGGYRKWFSCSNCGRRVAVLYLASKYFYCRHCCNLNYGSQHENKAFRYVRKAHNIQVRLGGGAGSLNPFPDKPKGMHWKTYRLLEADYYRFDRLSWESIGQLYWA